MIHSVIPAFSLIEGRLEELGIALLVVIKPQSSGTDLFA